MVLRKVVIVLGGSALAMIGAPAMAQSAGPMSDTQLQAISGMIADLKVEKGEEAKHAQLISQSDDLAVPKDKELKIYVEQIPALRAAYRALDVEMAENNAEAVKQHAALSAHNAGCPQRPPRMPSLLDATVRSPNSMPGPIGSIRKWRGSIAASRNSIKSGIASLAA